MDFDANSTFLSTSTTAKDFAKKKRVNRSAKLKQCKLDARRQQWLSQVKNKEGKEEGNGSGGIRVSPMHGCNERDRGFGILEFSLGNKENDGSLMNNYSDSDSSSNSPTSKTRSVVGSNCSGTNFTGSGSSSRSSRSSGVSFSGNMSEDDDDDDDDDDDGCLDDWEAVADALEATGDKQEQHDVNPGSPAVDGNITPLDSLPELSNPPALEVDISRTKQENGRAWRPDDAFRPQSLPNLQKQNSFPMKFDRHGGTAWVCKNIVPAPSSCPICCDDLDLTDLTFLPCSCGFRLCLFCHKRILEEDGRCPGCRKQYDYNAAKVAGNAYVDGDSPAFRLARSFSMITRS